MTEKILANHEIFRNNRFLLQMAIGAMPHDRIMRGIELYGTKVAPAVRKAVGASVNGLRREVPLPLGSGS